jgi:two-component system cell cycle response regulator
VSTACQHGESVDTAIARGRVAAASALGGAWLGFYASWTALRPGGSHAQTVFADTAYLVPIAAACALGVLAAVRATHGLRLFWSVVAVSNGLWLAGESLWSVKELALGETVPSPWWTDLLYLGSSSLLPVAIVLAFRPTVRLVSRAVLLDAALVVGTLVLVWWYVLLRPLPLGLGLGELVGLAYPSVDLVVLGLLLVARLLPARQGTLALRLFGAGILATALADGIYTESVVTHSYVSGTWLDLGWQAEAVLLALAAYVSAFGLDRTSDWLRGREPARIGTAAIAAGTLAAAFSVLVASHASTGTLAASVALGALLVARLWVAAARDRRPLLDPETGAYGPEYLQDQLRLLAARGRRFGNPFALALVDVDAAAVGSAVDVEVARRVLDTRRDVDAVARLAPGRLAVLMPQIDESVALGAAELIRSVVAGAPVSSRDVTVSVGVSAWSESTNAERLLQTAEAALERAHRLGGNQARAEHASGAFDGLVDVVRAVDRRENAGADHSLVIAEISRSVALALGLSQEEAGQAYIAGLLHDVGKVVLPDWLLRKPGPLNAREWEAMTTHPERGALLLSEVTDVRDVAPIVAAHHERWDGSGYPFGLEGERIPLGARIVGVVDALVSMTSPRSYRQALPVTGALTDIWRLTGTTFDAAPVGALFALVREGRVRIPEPA